MIHLFLENMSETFSFYIDLALILQITNKNITKRCSDIFQL